MDNPHVYARVSGISAAVNAEGTVTHHALQLEAASSSRPGDYRRCGPAIGYAPLVAYFPEPAVRGLVVGSWVRLDLRAATDAEGRKLNGEESEALSRQFQGYPRIAGVAGPGACDVGCETCDAPCIPERPGLDTPPDSASSFFDKAVGLSEESIIDASKKVGISPDTFIETIEMTLRQVKQARAARAAGKGGDA